MTNLIGPDDRLQRLRYATTKHAVRRIANTVRKIMTVNNGRFFIWCPGRSFTGIKFFLSV